VQKISVNMGEMGDMFNFKSKFFKRDICKSWKGLQEERHLCDMTLACTEGAMEVHKLVLSACSPIFRNLIMRHPHNHPMLYLKDVKYNELVHMLSFMYQGEINIPQEELQDFLHVGQDLQIAGLTQENKAASAKSRRSAKSPGAQNKIEVIKLDENKDIDKNDDEKEENLKNSNPVTEDGVTKNEQETVAKEKLEDKIKTTKRPRNQRKSTPMKIEVSPGSSTKTPRKRAFPLAKFNHPDVENEIKEPPMKALMHNHSIFSKHWDMEPENTDDINTRNEEGYPVEEQPIYYDEAEIANGLKQYWQAAVREGGYTCEHCDYTTLSNSNFNKHVKAKHLGVRYACEQCEYKATDQSNLKKHVKSVHYGWPFARFPMIQEYKDHESVPMIEEYKEQESIPMIEELKEQETVATTEESKNQE